MIFTIDVEDWAQSVLDNANPVHPRVYDNTLKVMDLLAEQNQIGTFFILGNVAKKFPELIRRIAEAGHEVASHGFDHKNIHTLTPEEVRMDVEYSVKVLEDAGGQKVIGFRAPNFSIREYLFEWYCEALAENGLKYDSSLFPMRVIKYGIEREYSLKIFKEYNLHEHYLSYVKFGNTKLPFFGGGYFRLLPYPATKKLVKQLNPERAVFYMHPYEVDTGEREDVMERYDIPLKWRLTQFVNRNTVEGKLKRLFADYQFTSFQRQYHSETLENATLEQPEKSSPVLTTPNDSAENEQPKPTSDSFKLVNSN